MHDQSPIEATCDGMVNARCAEPNVMLWALLTKRGPLTAVEWRYLEAVEAAAA